MKRKSPRTSGADQRGGPAPGAAFIQPRRPRNNDSDADTYTIILDGTTANWIAPPPEAIRAAPGKVGWIGLRVRLPPVAAPGTYTLKAKVRASTNPQEESTLSTSFSVRRPPGKTNRGANVH
ncbi:MAG: hypothetical protein GXP31_18550 [Kiritimatiellaeota bacterium]|nr:hypothetical protein [Kiritimatiellota bacterium]